MPPAPAPPTAPADANTAVADAAVDALPALLARRHMLAWLFSAAVCAGLALVFRADGWRRLALLYSFLVALVTTQLTVHWVLHDLAFPYSSFLTFLQFAALWLVTWLVYGLGGLRVQEPDGSGGMPFRSRRFLGFYASRIVPIVLTIAVSVAANNASLGLIEPGLNAVLGNMTPALTGALAALFGARHGRRAWLALGLAVVGGCCALRGGLQAAGAAVRSIDAGSAQHWLGIGLSFAAMLFRALKTVVIDRSLRKAVSGSGQGKDDNRIVYPTLAPAQLLLLQTPAISLTLLLFAALDPGGLGPPLLALRGSMAAFIAKVSGSSADGGGEPGTPESPVVGWLLLPGIALNLLAAGVLNVVGILVVQQLGATAMQIVGKCNIFLVMAFSAAYSGETITLGEVAGAALVLFAAHLFSAASTATRAGPKEAALPAPTSGGRPQGQTPRAAVWAFGVQARRRKSEERPPPELV